MLKYGFAVAKLFRQSDTKAGRVGQLRIIDESGEDYLYPADRFIAADLPQATRKAVLELT